MNSQWQSGERARKVQGLCEILSIHRIHTFDLGHAEVYKYKNPVRPVVIFSVWGRCYR